MQMRSIIRYYFYQLIKLITNFENIPNTPNGMRIFFLTSPLDLHFDYSLIKIDFRRKSLSEFADLQKDHIDLYLTGKCTQDCIACPQPRKARNDIEPKDEALRIANLLFDMRLHINISGGEPTFNKSYFIKVLTTLQNNSPKSSLQILTNSLSFSNKKYLDEIVKSGIIIKNLLFSIAIYGSDEIIQDRATKIKGSFNLLEKAVDNILEYGGKVELRIVINKLNYKDLINISDLIISKYKSRIVRVVFMGIEMSGEAGVNQHLVWIPFGEHSQYLDPAIIRLLVNNFSVYLYNYPLCFLTKNLWSLSKDSISYWKKHFLIDCNKCIVQNKCPGFFESTIPYITKVYPIIDRKCV